jgi:hypothetical protein
MADAKRPTKRARNEAVALLRDKAAALRASAAGMEARDPAIPFIARHRAKAERYERVAAYLADAAEPQP